MINNSVIYARVPHTGGMNQRVTIQSASRVIDAGGGNALTWAAVATVWARVMPAIGREQIEGGGLQGVNSYRVFIRYRTGVAPSMRLLWGSTYLNIRSVIRPDERNAFLEMLCDDGVAPT